MESLKVIRRRIRSVTSTKQITKAMQMVAAARLRKAQAKLETSRPYASKMQEILENLSTVSGFVENPLFKKRNEIKKTLLILITSDRSLCGSYNSNLINFTTSVLSQYSTPSIELGLIGRKGFDFYKRRSWPIKFNYLHVGGNIPFVQIKELTNQTVESFLTGEVDEVFLIYTKFLNIASRKIVFEKFLNIEKPQERKSAEVFDYIFEPDPAEIFNGLLPRYCITKIQMAILESGTSEQSARMLAMQQATKNAEEMVEYLTLVRNKARQASITKEILEIASGAEALKEF